MGTFNANGGFAIKEDGSMAKNWLSGKKKKFCHFIYELKI